MSSHNKNKFIFILGIIGGLQLRVIGIIYVIELVAIISIPFITLSGFKSNPNIKLLYKMMALWLIGAIVSDIVNHTPSIDLIKGWTSIIIFGLQIPFAYWFLEDNHTRWIWYVAGSAVSTLINFYLIRSVGMSGYAYDIYQLYAWGPIVLIVGSLFYYFNKHLMAYLIYMLWAFFSLFHGSRNVFLTVSIAVALLIYINNIKATDTNQKILIFKGNIRKTILFLAIVVFVINYSYGYLAQNGYLGPDAYYKYVRQRESGSILEGGRSATFMGLELVKRKPIIGYGSFAKDEGNAFQYEYAATHDVDLVGKVDEDNQLPAHSHIIGYWVYHGIFGGVFWIFVLLLIIRYLKNALFFFNPKLAGLFITTAVTTTWDLFFSPFGFRAPMAFFIVYMLLQKTVYIDYQEI